MATKKLLPLVQMAGAGLLDQVAPVTVAPEDTRQSMMRNPYETRGLPPELGIQQNPYDTGRGFVDSFQPMQAGGGRFVTEEDATVWNSEKGTFEKKPEAPWYKRMMDDPAFMDRLALGFNTMRLNPDQQLASILGERIKKAGEIGREDKAKNKTLVALKNMGLDEAELNLLAENPELMKVAVSAMYKARTGEDTTAEIKTMEWMTRGLPENEKLTARRMAVGLEPKASSVKFQNLGSSIGVFANGQQVATLPIDFVTPEIAKGLGKDIAGARSDYSSIKATIDVQRSALQSMINDPAVNDIFGTVAGATPSIRQASVDAEARLGQIKGGAFLQAIQAMRGMGALSNAEGEAATRAATALNLRMSPEAAKEEMRRMMAILDAGQERALRGTRVDPNEVPSYIKDWKDTYSSAGKPVKIGGSTITEVK